MRSSRCAASAPRSSSSAATSPSACSVGSARTPWRCWYEGTRGYQPLVAVWAEEQLIVADEFRDGNVADARRIRRSHRDPASRPWMAELADSGVALVLGADTDMGNKAASAASEVEPAHTGLCRRLAMPAIPTARTSPVLLATAAAPVSVQVEVRGPAGGMLDFPCKFPAFDTEFRIKTGELTISSHLEFPAVDGELVVESVPALPADQTLLESICKRESVQWYRDTRPA